MNLRRTFQSLLATGILATSLIGAVDAHASVVVAGTRVIYNASDKEVTLKLSNAGKAPALTQVWLDKGDPKASPTSIEVPFTVTPPVARIDPGKGQTLRILYTGEALPQDKESVFYLNMLEVPPKPDAADNRNSMQLAIRTRIKFFFRPTGLQGSALDAPAKVTWRLVSNGKQDVLEGHNPTPYHVSFAALDVTGGARFDEGDMIAPGETRQFPLTGTVGQGSGRKVHYHAINDYGGPTEGDAPLP